MEYLHIRNLEKYHPGYKDRSLKWAKIHFNMVQGDPDCEMIENEMDWARLVKFILLELQAKKPLPLDERYLIKKGFNLKKRPITLTVKVLHNFIEVVTVDESNPCVPVTASISISNSVTSSSTSNSLSNSIKEIIDDLNLVLGTKYRYDADKTNDLIKALLKKFTIEDFKTVHRKMLKVWGTDTKMVQYLRPITLYSNKFEGYLNQKEVSTKLTEIGIKAYLIGQEWLRKQQEKDNVK